MNLFEKITAFFAIYTISIYTEKKIILVIYKNVITFLFLLIFISRG